MDFTFNVFTAHPKDDDDSLTKRPRNLPPDGTTFNQISLGKRLEQTLPAYGYWNVQFYQMESAFVNLDLKLPKGASLGLYARRNALPTHTNYDLMEVVKGNEEKTRTARAVKVNFILLSDCKVFSCELFIKSFKRNVFNQSLFSFSPRWKYVMYVSRALELHRKGNTNKKIEIYFQYMLVVQIVIIVSKEIYINTIKQTIFI
jgi:hypothetical protein